MVKKANFKNVTMNYHISNYKSSKSFFHKPSTSKNNELIIRKYIRPYFKNVPLSKITLADVSAFLKQLHAEGLRKNYIANIYTVLHALLNKAKNWNRITVNPCSAIKQKPKFVPGTAYVPSKAEANRLLKHVFSQNTACNLTYPIMLAFIVCAGMQFSELKTMLWGHIDFLHRQINFSKNNKKSVNNLKVKLSRKLYCYLKKYKKQQILERVNVNKVKTKARVFVQSSKLELNYLHFYSWAQKQLNAVGISGATLESLRHVVPHPDRVLSAA